MENVSKQRVLDISNIVSKNNYSHEVGVDGVLMQFICMLGSVYGVLPVYPIFLIPCEIRRDLQGVWSLVEPHQGKKSNAGKLGIRL